MDATARPGLASAAAGFAGRLCGDTFPIARIEIALAAAACVATWVLIEAWCTRPDAPWRGACRAVAAAGTCCAVVLMPGA